MSGLAVQRDKGNRLEHDPEKWKPVFPKRSRSAKKLECQSTQSKTIAL
jgi:hypothetical protein